ncbi:MULTISPECIES: T9SS type A sorting domain-containing protein [unclassified Carboxylicivirga]|uniref:T9SS type A sorting domain-containing protein n=1 Tax=Carboxylicivirga TaxID=1628153 RepID=UPI003D329300
MKNVLLLLCLIPTLALSQTLMEENFDNYADYTGITGPNAYTTNNGYAPGAVSKWELDAGSLELTSATMDYFYVNVSSGNGELHARDIDGSAYFTSESIDISTQTGEVSLKIGHINFNAFTTGNFAGNEYIDVYYSTDAGANYTLIPHQDGSEATSGHTFANDGNEGVDFTTSLDYSFDPGAANHLILRIRMYNNGGNERFELDDISVERNTVTLWSEDFDSYDDNYGYIGIASLTPDQVTRGDYPHLVSQWSLSPEDNFNNQNDYAAVRNGRLIFNDVDNPVKFETSNIDISGVSSLSFSCDISVGSSFEGDEYLDIYYSTDGGNTYQLEGSPHTIQPGINIEEGNTLSFNKSLSGLNATNFRIKMVAFNNSNVEDFEIDNLIVVNDAATTISKQFNKDVHIHPNPMTDNRLLIINSPSTGIKNITIYNTLGSKVFSTSTLTDRINLPFLQSGHYIFRMEQENKTVTKKLIIN